MILNKPDNISLCVPFKITNFIHSKSKKNLQSYMLNDKLSIRTKICFAVGGIPYTMCGKNS